MEAYTPVSCDFQDVLESLATLKRECKLVYRNESDENVEVQGLVVDIYASKGADYLKMQDGTEIRLDRVVSVDGKLVSEYTE